ncbi:hypothetical protein [Bradyrhizobium sp. LHD-71]|uniref:hypothetical protein n=1 Tax=Bradyrhizobium sp. LHD-71 TaxID=3072141 RepID=UPI00280D6721|nr:hypothetical protein [Bradyrhizobium sp. LHD-71]MDQ8729870.1 hypothetical protein [Bradyrhizobium sp. LHD-71]
MNILIAVAAGCAAGLMFASIVSGALISLLLFYLAPLPLMVAALGWGPTSALIGAVTAGAGLGLAFGFAYFAAFIVTVGLPAFWLGHLTLLAQPATAAGASSTNGLSPAPAEALEWYPPGRLVLWIAVFACLITLSALLTLGSDYETIMAALRRGLTRIIGARGGAASDTDTDAVLDAIAQIAPAAATLVAMFTLTLNLWLSGKIVLTSGRLHRPWPDLRSIELPQVVMIVLAATLALSFTSGLLAMLSQIASAALLTAYMLVGFAVLHVITQSSSARLLWLIAAYGGVVILGWPALIIVMLGLLEGAIGLRRRFAGRAKPPSLSS